MRLCALSKVQKKCRWRWQAMAMKPWPDGTTEKGSGHKNYVLLLSRRILIRVSRSKQVLLGQATIFWSVGCPAIPLFLGYDGHNQFKHVLKSAKQHWPAYVSFVLFMLGFLSGCRTKILMTMSLSHVPTITKLYIQVYNFFLRLLPSFTISAGP